MRRRGFTLVETLVAAFVAGLIMLATYQMFILGARLFMRGQARTDLQGAGLQALRGISTELRMSAASTLTICADPGASLAAMGFRTQGLEGAPPSAFTPQPYFVVYFADASRGVLVRKTWGTLASDPANLTPNPLSPPRRLTRAELIEVCITPNGTEHVLTGSVAAMSIQPTRFPDALPGAITYPDPMQRDLRVGLTLNLHQTVLGQEYVETVSTAVSPRNRL